MPSPKTYCKVLKVKALPGKSVAIKLDGSLIIVIRKSNDPSIVAITKVNCIYVTEKQKRKPAERYQGCSQYNLRVIAEGLVNSKVTRVVTFGTLRYLENRR